MNTPHKTPDNLNSQKRQQRYFRMRKTVGLSGLAKMFRFGTQIIAVGATVRYLGPEQYGIWMTVMAGLGWISFGQFGIGPGLTNALAHAHGSDDQAQEGVFFTSALYIILTVASVLFAGIFLLNLVVDFSTIIQISAQSPGTTGIVNTLVVVCAGLFLLRFPLSIFESTYTAYQEGYIGRIWEIGGQITSLGSLFFLLKFRVSLPLFVLVFVLASEMAVLIGGIYYVVKHRPNLKPGLKKFSFKAGKKIVNTGAGFFMIQLSGYLLMSGGVLVLSHYHGPAAVTPYSVTWQMCMMVSGVWMMLSDALWGAFGEARASQDWIWIRSAARRLIGFVVLGALLFSLLLVVAGRPVIALWSGANAVPSSVALLWIALFSLVFSLSVLYGQILNALGVVWPQMWSSLLNGIVSVVFSFWLVPSFGLAGLAASLSLSTLFTTAWVRPMLLNQILGQNVKKTVH